MELSLSTSSASPAVLRRQASPLLHKQQVLGVSFASALKPGGGGALRFPSRRPIPRPITCSASPSTAEPASGHFFFLSLQIVLISVLLRNEFSQFEMNNIRKLVNQSSKNYT